MKKTKRETVDEPIVVVAADGRLCVNAAARSNIVQALGKLRALPRELDFDGGRFRATLEVLEAAMASPVALEVSTYYELAASIEDAMADAMQSLLDMAPPDETSPQIYATLHFAKARALCFRHFATIPGDDDGARDYLLRVCGVYAAIEQSIGAKSDVILRTEAEAMATELSKAAEQVAEVDPVFSERARSLADALRTERLMAVSEFFERRAEVTLDLVTFTSRFLLLHELLPPDQQSQAQVASRNVLNEQASIGALSAAACEFLAGFFARRPPMEDDNAPPIVLN